MGWTGSSVDHNRPIKALEAIRIECGEEVAARVLDAAIKPGLEGRVVYAAVRDGDEVRGLVVLVETRAIGRDWSWRRATGPHQGGAPPRVPLPGHAHAGLARGATRHKGYPVQNVWGVGYRLQQD
jgi:hypothetical protein